MVTSAEVGLRSYKVVPPLVINWFINPINYRYITYKPLLLELFAPTERYRLGTPPFFGWQDEFRDVLPLTN